MSTHKVKRRVKRISTATTSSPKLLSRKGWLSWRRLAVMALFASAAVAALTDFRSPEALRPLAPASPRNDLPALSTIDFPDRYQRPFDLEDRYVHLPQLADVEYDFDPHSLMAQPAVRSALRSNRIQGSSVRVPAPKNDEPLWLRFFNNSGRTDHSFQLSQALTFRQDSGSLARELDALRAASRRGPGAPPGERPVQGSSSPAHPFEAQGEGEDEVLEPGDSNRCTANGVGFGCRPDRPDRVGRSEEHRDRLRPEAEALPEPDTLTLTLMAFGLLALAAWRRTF